MAYNSNNSKRDIYLNKEEKNRIINFSSKPNLQLYIPTNEKYLGNTMTLNNIQSNILSHSKNTFFINSEKENLCYSPKINNFILNKTLNSSNNSRLKSIQSNNENNMNNNNQVNINDIVIKQKNDFLKEDYDKIDSKIDLLSDKINEMKKNFEITLKTKNNQFMTRKECEEIISNLFQKISLLEKNINDNEKKIEENINKYNEKAEKKNNLIIDNKIKENSLNYIPKKILNERLENIENQIKDKEKYLENNRNIESRFNEYDNKLKYFIKKIDFDIQLKNFDLKIEKIKNTDLKQYNIQLENIEKKIKRINQEFEIKQNYINDLENNLKNKMYEYSKQKEEYYLKIEKMFKELKSDFENQIKKYSNENQINNLLNKIENYNKDTIKRNEYENMINKYDLKLEKFDNLNPDSIELISNQLNNLDDKIKIIKLDNDNKNMEISSLTNLIKKIDNENDKKLKKINNKIDELFKDLYNKQTIKQNNDSFKNENNCNLSSINNNLYRLENKINEIPKNTFNFNEKEINKKIKEFENNLKIFEIKIQNINSNIIKLYKDNTNNNNKLNQELSLIVENNLDLKNKIFNIENKLYNYDNVLNVLKLEKEDNKKKIDEFEKKLNKEIPLFIKSTIIDTNNFLNKNNQYINQIEEIQDLFYKLNQENRIKFDKFEEKINNYDNLNKDNSRIINSINNKIDYINQENKSNKQKLNEIEVNMKKLIETNNDNTKAKINEIEDKVCHFDKCIKDIIQDLENKYNNSIFDDENKTKIKELENKFNIIFQDYKTKYSEQNEIENKKQLNIIENKLKEIEGKIKDLLDISYLERLTNLEKKIQINQEKIKKRTNSLNELEEQKKNDIYKSDILNSTKTIKDNLNLKNKNLFMKKEMRNNIENYNEILNKLIENESKINNLDKDNREIFQKFLDFSDALKNLQKEIDILIKESKDYKENINDIEEKIKVLIKDKNIDKKLSDIDDNINKLDKDYKEKFSDLEIRFNNLKSKKDKKTKKISIELDKKNNTFVKNNKKELKKLEQKIYSIENENKTSQSTLNTIEIDKKDSNSFQKEQKIDDIKKKINDFQIKKNINENEYLNENTINNKTNDNNNLIHHHLDKKLIFKNKKIKELTCKNLKDLINGEEDKKEEKIELKNVKKSLKNINSNLIPQNETIEGFQNEEHQIFQYKKPKKQKPILYSNYNENILYNIIHLEEQDDFLNTEITNNNSTITSLLNSNNNSINFSNTNSLCNSQSLSYKKNDNQSSIFRSNIQGENLNNNYYIEYNENEEEEEELEYDRKKDDEEIKYTNMIDNYETEQKNKIKGIKLENDHNQFNNYNHNFYDLNTNNDYVNSYEDFKFENKNNNHFKSRDIDKNINLFTEKNSKIKNNHNNHRYYDSIDNIDEDLKVQKDNNQFEEKK